MIGRLALLAAVVLLVGLTLGTASAHYTPRSGDTFSYAESIDLLNGTGNYFGYTESTTINGSLTITGVAPNGTESARYYYAFQYQNSTPASFQGTSSGPFTFSAQTFLYVDGTDNQTGYTNPYVWFFMDDSLALGSTFYALNTEMTVMNTSYNFDLNTGAGGYVKTIFAEGTGSYLRNDSYGKFDATYTWKMYFDPATGYIVGYYYAEQDSDGAGNGFSWTDSLGVTQTSYPLTAGSAPSNPTGSGGASDEELLVAIVVVVVVVVIIVLAVSRARRRPSLPRHSYTGQTSYAPPPMGPPPPGIHLTPYGQPAVQQIVVKETVKVNCRYCGALIDTTAEKCPFCGAART